MGNAMAVLDFSMVFNSWHHLLVDGLGLTLQLTIACAVMGLLLGIPLALMRLYGYKWLRTSVGVFINFIRSIPLILVIFWFYFLAPYFIAWVTGAPNPVQINAFTSALITFTIFEACYYCEILRAGISAVPKGQQAAAKAMGLTYVQTLRLVIIPQAIKNVLPILLLQAIVLFQDISLVYVLSLTDFVHAATQIGQQQNQLVEVYLFVALVYFAVCFLATRAVALIQRRQITR
jgi:glutamate/aspartate transport system permease protein